MHFNFIDMLKFTTMVISLWGVVLSINTVTMISRLRKARGRCRNEDYLQFMVCVGYVVFIGLTLIGYSQFLAQFSSVYITTSIAAFFAYYHVTQRLFFSNKAIQKFPELNKLT